MYRNVEGLEGMDWYLNVFSIIIMSTEEEMIFSFLRINMSIWQENRKIFKLYIVFLNTVKNLLFAEEKSN